MPKKEPPHPNPPLPGKVDVVDTSTWVRYRAGMCEGCWGGCCTMPVTVSSEDLYHMGYLEAHQVNGPLKRVALKLMREGIVKSYRDRTRTFVLQTKNGHDCLFLDENRRCSIYDRRPYVCRKFPLNSARPGYCPKQKKRQNR